MPAPTHDQLKALIQQETDMFDALVEASNDAYIVHRAWRELVIENERLTKELHELKMQSLPYGPLMGARIMMF